MARARLAGLLMLGLALTALLATAAMAANTTTQTVTYEVSAINEISDDGDPGALTVSTATAGSEPDDATDSSTTYAITTNGTTKKLTGKIDTAMPANVTLQVNLTAPTGGVGAGDVTLTGTDADLVTSIETVAESGKTIAYTLSATVAAGVVASAQKTVTLTLTDE